MSAMDYYPSKKETMQNIQLTIDGETKNLELIDMETPNRSVAKHLINNKWYREVEEKKEWEIQSFKATVWNELIYTLKNNEDYWMGGSALLPLEACLQNVANGFMCIHAVKRLSDGEVFKVETDHTDYGKITKIYIEDNKIWLKIENGLSVALKGAVKKITKPTVLLTTHDGVKVTNPNQQLYICHKNFNRGECFANFISTNQNNIYFYHHKSREDYIIQNKPVPVSCIELAKAITFTSPQLDLLVAFFKRKQSEK